ncbi:hypothetical protein DEO72_LG6g2001 [Vigna unguiculata]|uniref:Uncharacterized protein n=1 Tax=Vigna unguiculata TaxID=3917 RepID=A0A4D6MA66_VIGUN|nr:hypothetical protein DEO72_LG6g2001 [Vigna unguiculata]
MAPGGAGRAARRNMSKPVAVAIDPTWRLAVQNAPGSLLEFRPVALWQRQADTTTTGSHVRDVGLEGLSP